MRPEKGAGRRCRSATQRVVHDVVRAALTRLEPARPTPLGGIENVVSL
jgi:hypothetical protein